MLSRSLTDDVGQGALGARTETSGNQRLLADAASFFAGVSHQAVVARTVPARWYAEELFARFAVEATDGSVDGRDPLA